VRTPKPNIRLLARRRDISALVDASAYSPTETYEPTDGPDSGSRVRAEAILALGALGHDAGGEAVRAGLRDADDSVCCAAVRVLHARGDGVALAEELGRLPAEGEARELAILALADLKDSMSAAVLAAALAQGAGEDLLDERVGRLLVEQIEKDEPAAQRATIRRLVEVLGDERGIVVDRAAELLVRLAPVSVGALVAALGSSTTAADAAYVLGMIRDRQTIGPLLDALRNDDPRVRRECAAALGGFEAREAVMPLVRATHDLDHGVRVQAATALERMGASSVIIAVEALLQPMIHDAVRSARTKQRRLKLPAARS
jgi:HEAT repeat protein